MHVSHPFPLFDFFSRESLSVRHPQLELDSTLSVAPVAPKRGDLPHPGLQRFLTAEVATRSAIWSKPKLFIELNMEKEFKLFQLFPPVVCVPLSVVSFGSLQRFLCFSCRVPADVGGSLKPGASPTRQPELKVLKGEPESPQTGTPAPSPDSPTRSSCQPNSPAESKTCNKNLVVRFDFKH